MKVRRVVTEDGAGRRGVVQVCRACLDAGGSPKADGWTHPDPVVVDDCEYESRFCQHPNHVVNNMV